LSAGGRDASFTVGGGVDLPVAAFLFGSDCACKVNAQKRLASTGEMNLSIAEETPKRWGCPISGVSHNTLLSRTSTGADASPIVPAF
jgi:hypothetical protein